jgi:hypothetical protein
LELRRTATVIGLSAFGLAWLALQLVPSGRDRGSLQRDANGVANGLLGQSGRVARHPSRPVSTASPSHDLPPRWSCLRCADYRPPAAPGGSLDRGVMRIVCDVTGWRTLACRTSKEHLQIFFDVLP